MVKKTARVVIKAASAAIILTGSAWILSQVTPHATKPQTAQILYGKLPLAFEANQGQTDSQVKFLSRGKGYALYLTRTEAVLHLTTKDTSAAVRMKFAGSNPAPEVEGLSPLPGKSNYFIGNDPKRWRTNVSHYARVRYHEVYPGVDLVYYGNQGQLEYDLVVAPGANPSQIRLAVDGASGLRVNDHGDLVVGLGGGEILQHKPRVYQEKHEIACRYVLHGGREAGFELGDYDASQALTIDPALSYSTFLGGSGTDSAAAITVDSQGYTYVAGLTDSANFPVTAGAYKKSLAGTSDAFVAKIDPQGTTLVYSTFLGGSSDDSATGIAVDSSGNAFVTGPTSSLDYPTTPGAFSTVGTSSTNGQVFVTKLNATGSALAYSTYLGNGYRDGPQIYPSAIALDRSGNACVAGTTADSNFPTTPGAFLRTGPIVGRAEAFVTKLNAAGTGLVYSTFLGGADLSTAANAIAVDSAGAAYVGGLTYSTIFPVTSGALQAWKRNPSFTGFVSKLDPTGATLQYSTYLGGSVVDRVFGIAVDSNGKAFVTGYTGSADFPVTPGALQTTLGPAQGFITQLNASGSALIYSTFFNGFPRALALDGADNAYVAGDAFSSTPVTANALEFPGPSFVSELNPAGNILLFSSTFIGDTTNAIALDAGGNVYLAGVTWSQYFPVTAGAPQTVLRGFPNAFVSKINLSAPACGYGLSSGSQSFPAGGGTGIINISAGNTTCSWVAVSYAPWITFTTAPSGSGYGSVGYSVAANTTTTARQGKLSIMGLGYTVTQAAGTPTCTYTITPSSLAFPASGGASTVTVIAPAGCTWGAAGASWITITSGASGSGNGTVAYTVAANPSGPRTGPLFVDGQTLTVAQAGLSLAFYPLTPCRIADTRGNGKTGPFGPPSMTAGNSRDFPILASSCAVPLNAMAYSLNITVVPPGPLTYLSIWPSGLPSVVSTLNSFDGRVLANAAIVPAGTTNGAVTVYTSNATDVIIDINGYFAPPGTQGLAFYPMTPCRVADTRGNGKTGSFGPPSIGAGATRSFPVASGSCVVPANAQAYSLNMTAVPSGQLGYLTTWPTGQSQPTVSTLNSSDGGVVANAAIVPAGTSGAISVFASNTTDLIIDINGYFAPAGGSGALSFYPAVPCRIADTRGNGMAGAFGPPSLFAGASRDFPIPSSSCGLPATAQAYSLNMTVVPPGPLTYLTVWPAGQSQPVVSTLNSFLGKVVANAAIVPAGTGGAVSVYVTNTTDLIIDVNGYFAP